MTHPLPAKCGPIEGGMGLAKPSGNFVCHFVFFGHTGTCRKNVASHFLVGCFPQGQPNKYETDGVSKDSVPTMQKIPTILQH